MDSATIDRLARALASSHTRRASLKLLTAIGLFASGLSGEEIAAKNGPMKRKHKRKNKRRKKRKRTTSQGTAPAAEPGSGPDPNPAPPDEICVPERTTCLPDGSQHCCEDLQCDRTVVGDVSGAFCCHPQGAPCTSTEGCCSGTCDFLVGGGTCAPCRGRTCNAQRPCCGGEECRNGHCGGCRDRAVSCTSDTQCCFSDCKSNACLSLQGGRCARDVDCRSCYLNQNCNGACLNGVCTV